MAEAPLEILCRNAVKVSILQYLEPSTLSVTVSRGLRFGRALWLETMQRKSARLPGLRDLRATRRRLLSRGGSWP